MTETFTLLLLAHAFADFILQPGWMVARKKEPLILLLHGLIVLITAQAALGQFAALPLLGLAAVHTAIDATKTYLLPRSLAAFMGDQAVHLVTIITVAALWPTLAADGLWANASWWPGAAIIAAGAIIAICTGGHAVGLLMSRFDGTDLPEGLTDGGRIIGYLERGMIFVLVLAGQPAGIGFLIAAKSILRYEATAKADDNEHKARSQKASEYVIIGTLASFGWAMVAAYATLALLRDMAPLGILTPLP